VDGVRREGMRGPEGRRPADVYVARWRNGTPAALDFTVASGLRPELLQASAEDSAHATRHYEGYRCSHLDTQAACQAEGVTFIPMVVEASGGGWGAEVCKVWAELA
jgi:hypothetical protein